MAAGLEEELETDVETLFRRVAPERLSPRAY